jgi:ferric-dicitrate binding protein FerR (iron transport regulator)
MGRRVTKNDNRAELEAADWLVRVQPGRASPQELREWRKWLAESPDHAVAFRRAEELWFALGLIPDPPWSSGEQTASALLS